MKYPVPRLKEETMREIVLGIVKGNILTSSQVPESMVRMVFFPLSMGAFRPPEEVVEKVLGSSEPPEVLEGEPPKPPHPGYPSEPEIPEKPILEKLGDDLVSQVEWGDLEESELHKVGREVDKRNREKVQAWERESLNWQTLLEAWKDECEKVDGEYAKILEGWRASLDQHKDAVEKREDLRNEWVARYNKIFKDWAEDFGPLYGELKNSFPRSINGYPMFYEVGLLHKEDWTRIRAAVDNELDRQKSISV